MEDNRMNGKNTVLLYEQAERRMIIKGAYPSAPFGVCAENHISAGFRRH